MNWTNPHGLACRARSHMHKRQIDPLLTKRVAIESASEDLAPWERGVHFRLVKNLRERLASQLGHYFALCFLPSEWNSQCGYRSRDAPGHWSHRGFEGSADIAVDHSSQCSSGASNREYH